MQLNPHCSDRDKLVVYSNWIIQFIKFYVEENKCRRSCHNNEKRTHRCSWEVFDIYQTYLPIVEISIFADKHPGETSGCCGYDGLLQRSIRGYKRVENITGYPRADSASQFLFGITFSINGENQLAAQQKTHFAGLQYCPHFDQIYLIIANQIYWLIDQSIEILDESIKW